MVTFRYESLMFFSLISLVVPVGSPCQGKILGRFTGESSQKSYFWILKIIANIWPWKPSGAALTRMFAIQACTIYIKRSFIMPLLECSCIIYVF